MRTWRSRLAISSSTPSSVPLRPILLASATASEYSSIGWPPVLPTISTTSCAPLAFCSATSEASSWSIWAAVKVPVRSVTCRVSFGMAGSACSKAGASNSAASIGSRRRITSVHRGCRRRCAGAEVHRGRGGNRLLVVHAEVRLDVIAEHLRGQVVGEGADHRVVLLHRLYIAVTRDGDAVLGTFQLRLQVLEQAVGLQLRIVLADHHQPRQRIAQFALSGLELLQLLRVIDGVGIDLQTAHPGARIGHLDEDLFFVLRVTLDRIDQVGHQVGAALVLVQHLRPGRLDRLVLTLDGVVAATGA